MTNNSPKALIVGHGRFAEGMISAVAQISGFGDRFVAVSNAGLSPAGIEDALRNAIDESGARIIFTDLPAGSCTIAARRLARSEKGLTVVTGVALPTILAFACGSDPVTATERGRESIAIVEHGSDA